ncbi:MAG: FixH family protein [Burkholderiaceae bacterium]
MMQTGNTVTPWYKQFWPWVLIGLPTSVVIASVVTYFLAINGMDSVISKDYYKEGLAVNADLERDKKAADLGLSADITIDGQNVTMKLSANDAATVHSLAGQPILLEIENLSFQDKDLSASLVPKGDGIWQGKIPANMSQATWLARLIGPDWRISHRLENTTPTHIVLKP